MEVLSHKKSIEWKVATYRIGMKIPFVRGGKTHYTSTERLIFLANNSQPHMIDNPSYVVESEIHFKPNEIIELNLVHLKINKMYKLTSLLQKWTPMVGHIS